MFNWRCILINFSVRILIKRPLKPADRRLIKSTVAEEMLLKKLP